MDLQQCRWEIDRIDREMTRLFAERMDVSAQVAEYKRETGAPVLDARREREKLAEIADALPEELKEYGAALYSLILELSRSRQERILGRSSELTERITGAIERTQPLFPERAKVACQGVEGAYSQVACEKLFRRPEEKFFANFEDVFDAIERGECRYGVLPLENSTAGSVNRVYDLMMRHKFHIVRSVRVRIDHSLLAKPGAKLGDVREVYSHDQAIGQCSRFLQTLGDGLVVTRCENTAVAARMVKESPRGDVAALSSRICAELYGLDALAQSVQDQSGNYTRFICIAKDLEIYPGADRTSLMMVLSHKPGSLYKVLARFFALGIDLIKLESRPMPDRGFEFMFYFDLQTSVYSPQFIQLMGEIQSVCTEFSYLGSYSEVI